MKILHIGPNENLETKYPVIYGFRECGIEVKTCEAIDKNIENETDKQRFDRIKKRISEFNPDFIFTCGGWFINYNYKEIFADIKTRGIPHVYWATEDSTFFDWCSSYMVGLCDFIFTTSEICIPRYLKLGKKCAHLPFCCIPTFHKEGQYNELFKHDIIVFSNNYYYKNDRERTKFRDETIEKLVKPLLNGKYDIKIYGDRWDIGEANIDPKFISQKKFPFQDAYKTAKIIIAIQWNYDGHICLKNFEILGSKGFCLTPYTLPQAKIFKNRKDLVYSNSPQETIQIVDYYLSHEFQRKTIAQNGQREVYENHNCRKRALQAIAYLRACGIIKN